MLFSLLNIPIFQVCVILPIFLNQVVFFLMISRVFLIQSKFQPFSVIFIGNIFCHSPFFTFPVRSSDEQKFSFLRQLSILVVSFDVQKTIQLCSSLRLFSLFLLVLFPLEDKLDRLPPSKEKALLCSLLLPLSFLNNSKSLGMTEQGRHPQWMRQTNFREYQSQSRTNMDYVVYYYNQSLFQTSFKVERKAERLPVYSLPYTDIVFLIINIIHQNGYFFNQG